MKVAVSFLSSDNYGMCVKKIDNSSADYIHVDFCDGKYVETSNITMGELCHYLSNTKKKLDVHLMAENPSLYFDYLSLLNVETITIHPKTCFNVLKTINDIKNLGFKVGLAINPDEDISLVMPFIHIIDEVLVMSVVPGKGGQSFINSTLSTVDELNKIRHLGHFIVAMDGGINKDTISLIKMHNVDMIISGSYVTKLDDYNEGILLLKA